MLSASQEAVESLVEDVEYLWVDNIPVYETLPDPVQFYREHVARNRPCLIRNQQTLSFHELRTLCPPDMTLQVDVTPDGHGDCLRQVGSNTGGAPCNDNDDSDDKDDCRAVPSQAFFVKPMECRMDWSTFCEALQTLVDTDNHHIKNRVFSTCYPPNRQEQYPPPPSNEAVFYYSRQNDCLRSEMEPVWQQLSWRTETLQWASQAFNQAAPDAVNLWMGTSQAVSSMHKDHYENLYHVLDGTKVFSLVPPAYVPLLGERPVPSGRFVYRPETKTTDNSAWMVEKDINEEGEQGKVPWITVDVTQSEKIPYRQVRVKAGDILYLPALWFHRVEQEGPVTIAINYWYDMNFGGPLWAYFHFLQQLKPLQGNESESRKETHSG